MRDAGLCAACSVGSECAVSEGNFPLGQPIRPEKQEPVERWVAVDPSKPHLQQSTLTGKWRNIRMPPSQAYPWFGVTT
jgi:hypothetical protein